jgi:3-deoxy-D-manno-octulosonic-acid transferase
MNIHYSAYKFITTGLVPALFPGFWLYSRITGRFQKDLRERMGRLPAEAVRGLTGKPRIWIHAVSLGEVKVASAIVPALQRLIPDCSIILSTFTEHGKNLAKETFGGEIPVIYAPLDFVGSVRKALAAVRPHAMVFLETEIWPAWVFEARRRGAKTALANGRISQRSIGKYLKFRPFFREVLKNFDVLSMVLEGDAARIKAMGADSRKIRINGNAKYDILRNMMDPGLEREMRHLLNLESEHKVFLAGSTRGGEEQLILEAYCRILEKFPETVLLITPRHIDRTESIEAMVQQRGLTYQLRADLGTSRGKRTAPVVICNTFGELFKIYSVGTIVFCGGSLVPLGGQNPMEPAVWGKAVFYGPSMENFLDAKTLLEEAGGAIEVTDSVMLAEKAIWLLDHPKELKTRGLRAREAVMKNQGAAERHANEIALLLRA